MTYPHDPLHAMNRRDFVRTSAAVASAMVVPFAMQGTTAATTSARRRAFRTSLKHGMIGEGGTLLEQFQTAAAAGFDGVELDSPNGFETEAVLAARDEAGIVIPGVVDSVHWRDTLGDPDEVVRARGVTALETALRDCHAYGGTTVLLVPGKVTGAIPYGQLWTRSQAAIRSVLPLAEELDVTIAIENVWNGFLMGPHEAARYLDEIDSPRVGFYFDVGNAVRYRPPAEWIGVLGRRIIKLDVKEYGHEEGFGVLLGDGDCDWPAVMTALDEIGYEGWGSAEVRGGDMTRLREIHRRMEAVLSA